MKRIVMALLAIGLAGACSDDASGDAGTSDAPAGLPGVMAGIRVQATVGQEVLLSAPFEIRLVARGTASGALTARRTSWYPGAEVGQGRAILERFAETLRARFRE